MFYHPSQTNWTSHISQTFHDTVKIRYKPQSSGIQLVLSVGKTALFPDENTILEKKKQSPSIICSTYLLLSMLKASKLASTPLWKIGQQNERSGKEVCFSRMIKNQILFLPNFKHQSKVPNLKQKITKHLRTVQKYEFNLGDVKKTFILHLYK